MEYRRLSKPIIILFFIILFSILFVSSIVYIYDYYYIFDYEYQEIPKLIDSFIFTSFTKFKIEKNGSYKKYFLKGYEIISYIFYRVQSKSLNWNYAIDFSYYQNKGYFDFISKKNSKITLVIGFIIYEDDYSKYYKEVDKELENTISKFSDYLNKQNIEFSFEKKMD